MEQVESRLTEAPLQVGHERQRVGRQDPFELGDLAAGDHHAIGSHHDTSERRTVASMRPWGSVVAI